jgi:hypothetical protein
MLQQSASDRRGILALLVSAGAAVSLPASSAAAAAAPARAAALSPLPVPPLTEMYVNAEGFKFNYPPDWVVAFDRTGSSGNGTVIGVVFAAVKRWTAATAALCSNVSLSSSSFPRPHVSVLQLLGTSEL